MPKTQNTHVVAPNDFTAMLDFAAALQQNFESLFQEAHDHYYRTTPPADTETTPGIVPVYDGVTFRLYVRFPQGWKSVTLA